MSALKLCALVCGDAWGPLPTCWSGHQALSKIRQSFSHHSGSCGFKVAVGCICSCFEAFFQYQVGVLSGVKLALGKAETALKAAGISQSGELQVCGYLLAARFYPCVCQGDAPIQMVLNHSRGSSDCLHQVRE